LFVRLNPSCNATLEIPVDSTDLATIAAWQNRIDALNLDD